MRKFRVVMSAEIEVDGKHFCNFQEVGEGLAKTEYDAVLVCSFHFQESLEKVVAQIFDEKLEPSNIEIHVESVKEVKQKNAKPHC